MRKTLTSKMRRQRCQRRAVLAAMIFATAAPSIAADSTSAGLRIVSPLPLTANTPTNRVQDNPFCEPILVPLASPMVQLASDHQVSPIRMKPIGIAVGLRSIGDPDASPAPVILVTPPTASPIQTNPMIGSVHHNHSPSSEVVVTDSANLVRQAPEARCVPYADPTQPQVISFETVVESETDTFDGALDNERLSAVEEVNEPASDERVGQELTPQEAEWVCDEPEPIMFSLTDFDQEELAEEESVVEEPNFETPDSIARSSELDGIQPITIDDPAKPSVPTKPSTPTHQSAPAEPIVSIAAPLVPIDFGSDLLPSLKNAPGDVQSSATLQKSGSGVVASLVSNANRYRPPVAVSTSPVPLIRNESTEGISLVRPTVTRVESLQLDPTRSTAAVAGLTPKQSRVVQASAAIDLHMNKAQVRTLTIGGTFHRISLADQAICQAINSGSNELKLIGTGCGVTELTIWADTGNGDEPKVRVFRIHVEDAVDTQGEAVSDKAETLNQSIARAFPNCRVQLRQENGQLVVAGDCDSDKSASGILKMVRKTCLIPVVDELRIR